MITHLYKIDLRSTHPAIRSYVHEDVHVAASSIDEALSKIKGYIIENDMVAEEHLEHLTIERVEVLGSYFATGDPRYTKNLYIS